MPLRNPPVSDVFGERIGQKCSHLVKFSIAFKKPFQYNAQDLINVIQLAIFVVVIDGTTFSLTDFRLHSVSLDYGRLLN